MKAYLGKSSLLLIMLGGTVSGLLVYNQVLSFLGKIFDFGSDWIFISLILLFAVSLLIARVGVRILVRELISTNAFNEINLSKVLKFFIGGFIGCYVAVSIVGTLLFGIYMLFNVNNG